MKSNSYVNHVLNVKKDKGITVKTTFRKGGCISMLNVVLSLEKVSFAHKFVLISIRACRKDSVIMI